MQKMFYPNQKPTNTPSSKQSFENKRNAIKSIENDIRSPSPIISDLRHICVALLLRSRLGLGRGRLGRCGAWLLGLGHPVARELPDLAQWHTQNGTEVRNPNGPHSIAGFLFLPLHPVARPPPPPPATSRRHHTPHITQQHTLDITHSTSHTGHHTPNITHPTSHIRHHTLNMTHPTSHTQHHTPNIIHPTSHNQHHTPNITHPTSHTQYHTPNITHSISHTQHHTFNITHSISHTQHDTPNTTHPTYITHSKSHTQHHKPNITRPTSHTQHHTPRRYPGDRRILAPLRRYADCYIYTTIVLPFTYKFCYYNLVYNRLVSIGTHIRKLYVTYETYVAS